MKRLYLLLLFVVAAFAGFSQAPPTISYQGVLYDTTGQLLPNGPYTLRFGFYDGVNKSASLWTETQSVVTVDGVFSVTLGSVNPIALAFDVSYWLGVKVGNDAELVPRISLTSVPYSFRAKSVDKESIEAVNIKAGQVVKSINGLRDSVTFQAGSNITLTQANGLIIISSTAPVSADNLLYPSGYAEEIITIDPENLFDAAGKQVYAFEIPEGKDLRILGNPRTSSSQTGAVYASFVGSAENGRPGHHPGFPCPLDIVPSESECGILQEINNNLLLSSNSIGEAKKRFVGFYGFWYIRNKLTLDNCSLPDVECPIITAALVPKISNAHSVVFKPLFLKEVGYVEQNLKYIVPPGYEFVVTRVEDAELDPNNIRFESPAMISINGKSPIFPTSLPLPYIFKSGTEIAYRPEVTPIGIKDPAPMSIQGYLKKK